MGRMTRGQFARRCEVNPATLRYYEQRGLLPEPDRSGSNYRLYGEDSIARVQFIKRAQQLGFTLKEIKELMELKAAPGAGCADVLARAEQKITDIDSKIRTLQSMRKALDKLTSECGGTGSISDCPIIEALELEDP